jgi:hypothetical protein
MPELALKKFKEDTRAASVSALNKLGARIKTRISTALRTKYNLMKREVDQYIRVRKANRNDLTIEIHAGTSKIGLDHFGKIKQGITGVQAQIIKGKLIEIKGSFIGRRKKGSEIGAGPQTVFIRKTEKRYPLRRVVGPSIADLASSRMIEETIQQVYKSDFPKLLESEIKYYSTR